MALDVSQVSYKAGGGGKFDYTREGSMAIGVQLVAMQPRL
jgi:hypothetical protein